MPGRRCCQKNIAARPELRSPSRQETKDAIALYLGVLAVLILFRLGARLGPYPKRIAGGPANPLGARALYLYEGNKDTLYRIHGTNQPEYIGHAISSGCIRMTNEDVIDLVNRVKPGAIVVVLPPGRSAS
jgi:hypothetical protein